MSSCTELQDNSRSGKIRSASGGSDVCNPSGSSKGNKLVTSRSSPIISESSPYLLALSHEEEEPCETIKEELDYVTKSLVNAKIEVAALAEAVEVERKKNHEMEKLLLQSQSSSAEEAAVTPPSRPAPLWRGLCCCTGAGDVHDQRGHKQSRVPTNEEESSLPRPIRTVSTKKNPSEPSPATESDGARAVSRVSDPMNTSVGKTGSTSTREKRPTAPSSSAAAAASGGTKIKKAETKPNWLN